MGIKLVHIILFNFIILDFLIIMHLKNIVKAKINQKHPNTSQYEK
jgi:hypothetical protein